MKFENSKFSPALFFCVNGKLLFHVCSLEDAEPYGMFSNFPHSHYDIWNDSYEQKYGDEYDYYPRGRVVYRSSDNTYLINYDKCMELCIDLITDKYVGKKVEIGYDEHYQCHTCNRTMRSS